MKIIIVIGFNIEEQIQIQNKNQFNFAKQFNSHNLKIIEKIKNNLIKFLKKKIFIYRKSVNN